MVRPHLNWAGKSLTVIVNGLYRKPSCLQEVFLFPLNSPLFQLLEESSVVPVQ